MNPAAAKNSLGKLDEEPYEPYEPLDFKANEFLPKLPVEKAKDQRKPKKDQFPHQSSNKSNKQKKPTTRTISFFVPEDRRIRRILLPTNKNRFEKPRNPINSSFYELVGEYRIIIPLV